MFPLLRILATATAVFVILDALMFRSGLYYDWTEPESTAGTVVQGMRVALELHRRERRNVLVIGDSKIDQGFSAKIANESSSDTELNFVSLGLGGTTPRVWWYVLRDLDPRADRFAAVVLMVDGLDDHGAFEDLGNRVLDLNYLAPLIRVADTGDLAASYSKRDAKERILRNALLPGQAMRSDLIALLRQPRARVRKVQAHRAIRAASEYDFPGHSTRLPDWPGSPVKSTADKDTWETYFRRLDGSQPARPEEETARYRERWYGAVARRYRAAGVPILLLPIPRGPYHARLATADTLGGALAVLAAEGVAVPLQSAPYRQMEEPEFFFDHFHLNALGRKRLSIALAQQVRDQLSSHMSTTR